MLVEFFVSLASLVLVALTLASSEVEVEASFTLTRNAWNWFALAFMLVEFLVFWAIDVLALALASMDVEVEAISTRTRDAFNVGAGIATIFAVTRTRVAFRTVGVRIAAIVT